MFTKTVAVLGPSEIYEVTLLEEAYDVGREIGARGALLVCGGLGGVMAAACRGAKEAGGTTLGLLPGNDRSSANRWLDIALPTGLGEGRNLLVIRAADAAIAVGGSWGTLSEVAFAVRTGIRVVALRSWTVRDATGARTDGPILVSTPKEAVENVLGDE